MLRFRSRRQIRIPNLGEAYSSLIEPQRGWQRIDWKEIWRHRELFYFLVRRNIKGRYAQSVLGFGWAVLQPVFEMIVFTVVFGKLAKISSDGVPYAVFSFAGLVPWAFFSGSLLQATGSLVAGGDLLTKVYFPRLILPLAAILARSVEFLVSMVLLFGLMAWMGFVPTIWALMLPVLVAILVMTSAGLGMFFGALTIQYRDVAHVATFLTRALMYASPIVYPASLVPDRLRILYALNPMTGVVEGFRSALLGTNPMPWDLIVPGAVVAVLTFAVGMLVFKRIERVFADVI